MKRFTVIALVVVIATLTPAPAGAYLKLGSRVGNRTVTLRWAQRPIRYFVTDRSEPGVSAQQFQEAMARAFDTWEAVDTAQISAEFAGFTPATPVTDSLTVLGFTNRADLERVLGATSFTIDTSNGNILEADIFFNSAFPWSVAAAGETGRFDLESIAVHEIGHLLGLAHSAIGETELRSGGRRVIAAESAMFPIAFASGSTLGRTLRADDMAGISEIYPAAGFTRASGSISGRITKDGDGVLGAHVTAFNLRTGKLIGGFVLNEDGSFTIASLDPGPHVLRVEPLDDGDIESFFDASLDIDLDFQPKIHDRLVVVPRGGGTRGVDIGVVTR